MGFPTCVLGLVSKTTGALTVLQKRGIFASCLLGSAGNQCTQLALTVALFINKGHASPVQTRRAVVRPSVESVQSDSAALPATDLRHTQCSLANKRKEVLPREEDRKIQQLPSQHSSELVPIIGRTHLLRKNSYTFEANKREVKNPVFI